MKNDYSFKILAVIIVAGVIVALFSPAPSPDASQHAAVETHSASSHATE